MGKTMNYYLKEIQKLQSKYFGKFNIWIETYYNEEDKKPWFTVTNMTGERPVIVNFYHFYASEYLEHRFNLVKSWFEDEE